MYHSVLHLSIMIVLNSILNNELESVKDSCVASVFGYDNMKQCGNDTMRGICQQRVSLVPWLPNDTQQQNRHTLCWHLSEWSGLSNLDARNSYSLRTLAVTKPMDYIHVILAMSSVHMVDNFVL